MVVQVLERRGIGRSEVHFHGSFGRDRIHGNSASNHAEVERAARTATQTATDKEVNRRRHRVHWIGPPEIRPAMPARACHSDSKTPAAKCLVRDALQSGTID